MVPAILISPTLQEQKKVLFDKIQKQTKVNRLTMQWTLDENSKLICRWLPDKH